jgi:integrase
MHIPLTETQHLHFRAENPLTLTLTPHPSEATIVAKKLMERVRDKLRRLHYSPRTEEAYTSWIVRFIKFHGLQPPSGLNARHVGEFLTFLAVEATLSASSQNQALNEMCQPYRLMAGLMYGSGLRVTKTTELRVKDLDIAG